MTVETARSWGWRGEVVGSDEGGREGGDEGRATREETSKGLKRGTHLTALFNS